MSIFKAFLKRFSEFKVNYERILINKMKFERKTTFSNLFKIVHIWNRSKIVFRVCSLRTNRNEILFMIKDE